MRKAAVLIIGLALVFPLCRKPERRLYTIGLLQFLESPTNAEVERGFVRALEDRGLRDGRNIRLLIRNGGGDIAQVYQTAQQFMKDNVDVIVTVTTPCLQAALIVTSRIPIVFTSVANPYLTRAGVTPVEHLPNVTGIASTGPIRQTLDFIHRLLPKARRIGTLWTPSEINSEYYLELARTAAAELGQEIVAVPVTNSSEVLLAAQVLVNKGIDAFYQISDNTINASFEALGKVAEENRIPLFSGFLLATHAGACASVGWDFFAMGYKAGDLVLRIKAGESPAGIPFESMTDEKISLNLAAAAAQGVSFPPDVIKQADEVIPPDGN